MTARFNAANGSELIEMANRLLDSHLTEFDDLDDDTASYVLGCVEGETAFAVAAALRSEPAQAIRTCKRQLLIRLGLSGNNLSIEQQRTRGWIVGMMGSIASALEGKEC
ncbi:hypothetical protein [Aquitalea sp. LB_tupeE]|uniref:hypothetical protein n=1 Tax=Aquitalea sp. LB_tupeE TaxID=2748078 RepID=UPI0015B87251|nr:hypothetical protein [Aquitalea sp. LB_tupeE]NWK79813.1 hypothetical protein [Aquitalea sp. LB_tupeE]